MTDFKHDTVEIDDGKWHQAADSATRQPAP
jgi:hypothetical protein